MESPRTQKHAQSGRQLGSLKLHKSSHGSRLLCGCVSHTLTACSRVMHSKACLDAGVVLLGIVAAVSLLWRHWDLITELAAEEEAEAAAQEAAAAAVEPAQEPLLAEVHLQVPAAQGWHSWSAAAQQLCWCLPRSNLSGALAHPARCCGEWGNLQWPDPVRVNGRYQQHQRLPSSLALPLRQPLRPVLDTASVSLHRHVQSKATVCTSSTRATVRMPGL